MSDISGFKFYETKPAKTFGSKRRDTLISECCQVSGGDYEDFGICPACKDFCLYIINEELEDE